MTERDAAREGTQAGGVGEGEAGAQSQNPRIMIRAEGISLTTKPSRSPTPVLSNSLLKPESQVIIAICSFRKTHQNSKAQIFRKIFRGTWLIQSVKHATLDLRVGSSSPMLGVEIALK